MIRIKFLPTRDDGMTEFEIIAETMDEARAAGYARAVIEFVEDDSQWQKKIDVYCERLGVIWPREIE